MVVVYTFEVELCTDSVQLSAVGQDLRRSSECPRQNLTFGTVEVQGGGASGILVRTPALVLVSPDRLDQVEAEDVVDDVEGVAVHGPSIPFLLGTLHRVENFFSDVRSDLRQEVGERRGIVVLEGDREARPEHDPRRVRQRTFLHLDAVLAGGVCVDDRELLDVIHGPSIPFPL